MATDKLIGRRNGRLVVQERLQGRILRCLCDCGKTHIVDGRNLTKTISCGCYHSEHCSLRSRTHGMSRHPEYNVWNSMVSRCHNESSNNYARYGGRGIEVCSAWRGAGGFERFLADMGHRPSPKASLDRIDNDGNYEPGNVRWATMKEQARNTRKTLFVVINGQKRVAVDVARAHGISRDAFNMRYNGTKWDILRAATQPSEERYLKTVRTKKALKASASA